MKELLRIGLKLEDELFTTVRLATGGVCSLAGLGLDDSEDCKVCVTEGLLLLMHAGYASAEIAVSERDGGLFFSLTGSEEGCAASSDADEISEALLAALAEDALLTRSDGRISCVTFSFGK